MVLTVGVHKQANPVAQAAEPYGQVSINYNLASRAIDRHLDRAVESHDEWKKEQESDVVRQMEILRQQLVDSVTVQEAKLKSLQEETSQIEKNLQFVAAPDTSSAFDFRNQLAATQLLLQLETNDASFRIGRLRESLEKNIELLDPSFPAGLAGSRPGESMGWHDWNSDNSSRSGNPAKQPNLDIFVEGGE